ncbi:lipid kinase, YegS/Rv2252/BmrU family [Dehalogenimonas alkenigignens]|uniref:Lipid kinase, YegS/Rv2252/BmrU family n=1 Tax=Dehalogenimonas alkenigignens TaxID=1217799 RepID=A0A0W0GKW7_9CHLR|nr:diacylglycerol kinase family protein [Dehalogenimonas alkenigignens]KTB49199.1 lipid kinase, YegS/Rv2252/BmrU family [Dehalogenimonas alkenigignens]
MTHQAVAKVIVNPAAGAGKSIKHWPQIKRQMDRLGIKYDVVFTERVGHGIELARETAAQHYRYIVAVGGDGTINEVVNGLLSVPGQQLSLGVVNTGSGSDFVRSLGIPRNPDRACHHLLSDKRLLVDVGVIEWGGIAAGRRYFVNAAGVGFDAEAVETRRRLPGIFRGPVSYVVGMFKTLASYRNKSINLKLDDSAEISRKALSVIVANGCYFGGGMKVAPGAELADQLFEVLTIGDIGKFELIQAFPRVYKGTHITHRKVRVDQASMISLSSDERLLLQADGEIIGEGAFRFSLLPGALSVIV